MIKISQYLREHSISFEENAPLNKKTWLKTGGIAALWISPVNKEQLLIVVEYLTKNNFVFDVIGHTSNIYYLDTCNPCIIVSTIKLREYIDQPDYIECECGVPVSSLSRYAVDHGYVGYSGLVNLPGTVGAAICNNSNCFDCSVSEHLIEATFFDFDKQCITIIYPHDLEYTHRSSCIKEGRLKGVILSVKLSKLEGDIREEQSKAIKATTIRHQTQEPPAFTLGSVYASFTKKKCLQNTIISYYESLLRRLHLNKPERLIVARLFIFGFIDIIPFVSKKNINTFIWLKNRQDRSAKFERYKLFMNRAFENPTLEIEIRG